MLWDEGVVLGSRGFGAWNHDRRAAVGTPGSTHQRWVDDKEGHTGRLTP